MPLKINRDFFIDRATRIFEAWKSDNVFANVDSLLFMVGKNVDDVQYSKSHSLQTWLYNCSLPDTILVITKSGLYFLGSEKKAMFFAPLETKEKENLHPSVPAFTSFVRNKQDNDKANFEKLLDFLGESGTKVGHFAKDKHDSDFIKSFETLVKEKNFEMVDVSLPFAKLFAVKDAKEIEYMRKSSAASVNAWGCLRKKIVDIVDTEKKVRHNRLSEDFEKDMISTQVQGNLASNNALEVCYTPIIQSGSSTALKLSAESNDKILHYGSVTCCMGARYMSYCSNVGRTLMVMPTPLMEELYEALLTTELSVIEALKPGRQLSEAFEKGMKEFKEKKPDYAQYLVKSSFGFATGIEFREGLLLINANCKQQVEKNMTFIVVMGLQNFPNPSASDEAGKTASIFISDTIFVCDNGPNEILTDRAKSRLRSNTIRFREKEEQTPVQETAAQIRLKRSVILQEQTRHKQTNEDKRKERQRELADQLNEEARKRLAVQTSGENAQKKIKSNISYKSDDKFPDGSEVEKLMIYVDKRHDTVIVPIFGIPVPFHISMIKNASQTVEGDYTCLRINFTHPGSQIGKDNALYPNPLAKFVKELSFKSSSVREPGQSNPPSTNLTTSLRLIKELQKRFRTMEAEEREKEGAVKQDKLILSNNKGNPKLKDLFVRPNIIAKRISGALEAHINGFRYTSLRGDKIDVLYNNIKHAFFQPCDNEMIILVHFNLKYPVLWGKKKYSDIQFYTEVGEITTDLGKYHHMQDRDDMQSEQMEREMRKKLNMAFQNFCDKVNRMTNEAVDFDQPFAELAFTGVPYRSSATLKPTASSLVNLTEWPPFVVALDEIELVHFERVTSNTKSFDMVIVFKDYRRKTQHVGHIPSSSLDMIKDWLNQCEIRYTEGPMSLNWANIMKTIVDDPTSFFENGGWNFLADSDDEGEGEDSEEESSFAPSDDDSEASDEDEEEEEASEASDYSESEEGGLESDESSGKDWSDLEEEAAQADKAKDRGDEPDTHQDRKRKGGGGSSKHPAPKRRR